MKRMMGIFCWLVGASVIPAAAELPSSLSARIRGIGELPQEAAAAECRALLETFGDSGTLPLATRARGLDLLRDACSESLSWTHPIVVVVAERAVASRRRLEQDEPAPLVQSLRLLGFCYHYRTHTHLARDLYQEAAAVARKWLGRGTDEEDVAAALELLSSAYLDLGNLEEGIEIAKESERLRRELVPPQPDKVVRSLNARARLEERIDLRRAKATWEEALAISRSLGNEHRALTGRMANNLGQIFFRLGEVTEAITYLAEAEKLRSYDPKTGKPAKQLAATQHLMAQILHELGDYPRAVDYYKKALPGLRAWLGEEPYRYADALSGYAAVLEESGDWDQALEKQLEALSIRERSVREKESDSSQGPDQELKLLLARSLCRFGMLQRRLGDAEARGSLERALAIQEAELGERPSADRARTLLELARWFDEEGQEFCAKALIDRSIEELKAVAPGSPMLVEAYGLAARLTSSAEAGLRMVEEGLSLSRSLYGEDTPRTAQLFLTRAELRRRDKRASFAIGDALDAHRISLQHVVAMIQAFPRDQALAFAADRRRGLDLALDMLAQNPGLHATHTAEVWQAAIASRRLVLDAEIERRRVLQATAEPRLAALAQELIAARQQFAYLLVQTYGRSQNLAGRLETARRRVITAEAALARETRPLLAADRDVSIEDLQRRLLPGSALVGVLQYRPSAGAHDAYLAMVLTGGGPPRPVALGDAASVDSLIAAWRESLLSYRGTERPAQTRRRLGMALRRRIWDPLASLLGPPGIVFFVPDGALQRVPLAALPTDDAHYLLEVGWSFHVLTGEQDLLEGPGERRTGPLLALGGIDYDSLSPQVAFARASASAGAKAAPASDHYPSRGEDADCLGPRLPFFEPLPGSLEEVRELVVMWKRMRHAGGRSCPVTLLTEARATEAAFRSAVGKHRVVHFATHGFVASSSGPVRRSGVRGIGGLSFGSVPTGGALPRPLSGLALAGANQRDTARNNDQDGILTEAEILDLDLDGVDWVVLSACGTGLGRIEPVEGVLGIRRAFQIAGAGTLILSLWSIDDLATRDWMRDLYAARFGRGLTTIESIRHASLEALARRRRQGDDNPALWAGFVATGKWN